jgi:hypothetical protein
MEPAVASVSLVVMGHPLVVLSRCAAALAAPVDRC